MIIQETLSSFDTSETGYIAYIFIVLVLGGVSLMFPLTGMRGGPKMHDPCVYESCLLFGKPCHWQRSWDPQGDRWGLECGTEISLAMKAHHRALLTSSGRPGYNMK